MALATFAERTARTNIADLVTVLTPNTFSTYQSRGIDTLHQAKFVRVGEYVLYMLWDGNDRKVHHLPHHKPLVTYIERDYAHIVDAQAARARELGQDTLRDKVTGAPTKLNDAGYLDFTYKTDGDSKIFTGATVGIDSLEYGRADVDGRKATIEIIRNIVGESFTIGEATYGPQPTV